MTETATALNVCQYLLLKAESASRKAATTVDGAEGDRAMLEAGFLGGSLDEDDVRGHPVIERLNQLNDLAQKLKSNVAGKVPDMDEQVSSLVKAAALMKNGGAQDSDDESAGSNDGDTVSSEMSPDDEAEAAATMKMKVAAKRRSGDESSSDADSSDEDEVDARRRVVTEAKFAFRPQDLESKGGKKGSNAKHLRRRAPMSSDFGDEDGAEEAATAAGRNLASTLNAISQRATSKKMKGGAAAASAPEAEDDDEDDRLMRGLAMMDDELGDDDDGDGFGSDSDVDNELDDDLGGDDFYSKIKSKSKAKKDMKKALYTPAPKFPNVEGEIDGERAIGQAIMKNRGLVAHKSKLNRNPRVKKREQYRKALIRRKGAVREVRTDEGHKYGGETTGIKSGVSRSRKLGVR
jgi:U3 small nucleolar RNA-associated protein 3